MSRSATAFPWTRQARGGEKNRGEYRMVGQTVTVTITDKHWLLPWPVVEGRLRKLLY